MLDDPDISDELSFKSKKIIAYVSDKLVQMAANAEAGLHANPGALVVYGNPPQGEHRLVLHTLLGFAEQVKYQRIKRPTGDYFHDFGPDDAVWAAEMWNPKGHSIAVSRVIVIANSDGAPLWGE
jgi:hypothetical protein